MTGPTTVELLRWAAARTIGEADADLLLDRLANLSDHDGDTVIGLLAEAFGSEAPTVSLDRRAAEALMEDGHYHACLGRRFAASPCSVVCQALCEALR